MAEFKCEPSLLSLITPIANRTHPITEVSIAEYFSIAENLTLRKKAYMKGTGKDPLKLTFVLRKDADGLLKK